MWTNATVYPGTALIHLIWNQIPSPRYVNTPFTIVIQALNSSNALATNFTSTVALQSTNGVPVNPAVSGNFIQGTWTGAITIAQTATNLVLQTTDNLGESGQANPINVLNPPALTTLSSDSILLIAWPISPSGFVIETSPSLSPANWVPITNQQPVEFLGHNLLPIPMSGTNAFFRLRFNGPQAEAVVWFAAPGRRSTRTKLATRRKAERAFPRRQP